MRLKKSKELEIFFSKKFLEYLGLFDKTKSANNPSRFI